MVMKTTADESIIKQTALLPSLLSPLHPSRHIINNEPMFIYETDVFILLVSASSVRCPGSTEVKMFKRSG
jgi:hypothetical protein